MGFPDQPQGQGQPEFPGDPWRTQQPPGGGSDQTQMPGGYQPPGGYQVPGGYPAQPGLPGYGGSGYPQQQPGYGQPKNNSLAIASLICGIAQFVLWWIFLIPGLLAAIGATVFGFVSIRQIGQRAEGGRGMAITGLVLGGLGVLGGIALLVLAIVGSAVSFHVGNVGN